MILKDPTPASYEVQPEVSAPHAVGAAESGSALSEADSRGPIKSTARPDRPAIFGPATCSARWALIPMCGEVLRIKICPRRILAFDQKVLNIGNPKEIDYADGQIYIVAGRRFLYRLPE